MGGLGLVSSQALLPQQLAVENEAADNSEAGKDPWNDLCI